MQRLYFSMICWDVWEYYGRRVQRSLYERQSDGEWHNGGMTESSVTAQYAAITVGSDYRASKMHELLPREHLLKMMRMQTNDEAYIQSSEPALRKAMNECRKRTWSKPIIQVSKSRKVAWLSATGEPLSPWAWVSPDTYRLLQVEVLTTDFGLAEGPLTMEHTGMSGCLEAFRWPVQLEMYKYRLSSPWVGAHMSPDKGMSLASAPMATEQQFAEEINGMFGTNHTAEEYQFVGCIQGLSSDEITRHSAKMRLLQWKNEVTRMLPHNLLLRQLYSGVACLAAVHMNAIWRRFKKRCQ